ncbi:MAG: hypothetical protein M1827_004396 [Pycnora praestabilis]|nr:MAG: hypothetical protein M1827_004396 [Pycnora praestabilis]
MSEKELYDVPAPAYDAPVYDAGNGMNVTDLVKAKGGRTAEAAVLYGDLETTENYGYVHRGSFFTAYIGILIYFLLYGFWRVFKKTKWIKAEEADIFTGKAALDAEDLNWSEQNPRNIIEKIWVWIAWSERCSFRSFRLVNEDTSLSFSSVNSIEW